MTSLVSKKHYIGNVSSSKFYYKDAILAYYNMNHLTNILPIELINRILSYVCSSLVVFGTNKTLHYVNPKDNAIIKSIRLKYIYEMNSELDTFAISEDGLTFYKMYLDEFSPNHLMDIEYLCDEVPDPNKPSTTNRHYENRYHYNYAINKIIPTNKMHLSTDGKYIALISNTTSCIVIYETKTNALVNEIKCGDEKILDVSLSPNNIIFMAITSIDNKQTVWIWNIKTGNVLYQHLCANDIIFDNFYNKISWNYNSTVKFSITFGVKNTPGEHEIIGSRILYGTLNDTYFIDAPGKDIFGVTWINDEDVACYNNCKIFINKWNHVLEEPFLDTKQTGHYMHKLIALDNHLIVISEDQSDGLVNRMLSRLNLHNNDNDTNQSEDDTNWHYPENTDNNQSEDEDNEDYGWGEPQEDNGWGEPQDNGWGEPQENNDWGQQDIKQSHEIQFTEEQLLEMRKEREIYDKWLEEENKDNYDDVENAYNCDIILIPVM